MLDELRDDPGGPLRRASLALVIVVLLTPAVGGMARLLGAVDQPGARRRSTGARAAARRARDLPRHLRPGARLPRPLGARCAASCSARPSRCVVGAIDDFRGLAPVAEARRAGRSPRRFRPRSASGSTASRSRSSASATSRPWIGVPLTIVWIVAVMNMVNFLDGLDGLAAGVCAISGVTFAVIALSLGKADAAILSAIVARRLPRLPAPQLLSRRGSSWATRARSCSASRSRTVSVAGPAEDGVHGRPLPAAARARGADPGHVVRRREAAEARPSRCTRPTAAHLHHRFLRHRLLAAARGADDVGLVRDARRRRRSRRASSRSARAALAPVADARGRRDRARRPRASRSTSSTCSRSSSSRTRASARDASRGRARGRAARPRDAALAATGTVAFVFTDIDRRRRRLLQARCGDARTPDVARPLTGRADPRRTSATARRGSEIDTHGDAFFFCLRARARDARRGAPSPRERRDVQRHPCAGRRRRSTCPA